MRESIGGAQILIIIVSIILVAMVVLTASISYSKAFKARNAIVNIVEKYASSGDSAAKILEKGAEIEIENLLGEMGYRRNIVSNAKCPEKTGQTDVAKEDNYDVCIYHFVDEVNKAERYGVLTYMYFEIPLFGRTDLFSFPIYADTISLRAVSS